MSRYGETTELARNLRIGMWIRGEAVVRGEKLEPGRVVGQLTGMSFMPVVSKGEKEYVLCLLVRQAWLGWTAYVPVEYAWLHNAGEYKLPVRKEKDDGERVQDEV